MTTLTITAGMRIEDLKPLTPPKMAKTYARGPSAQELDEMKLPDYGFTKPQHTSTDTPTKQPCAPTPAVTGHQTPPTTPPDLEASLPPTPAQHHDHSTGLVPSFSFPAMNRWRVLAACLIYFGNGMSDSAVGALIPSIETHYHIGYAVVSLIWITNAVGFILAAFCTEVLVGWVGRARALMTSEAIIMVGLAITAATPPFAAVVVAYFFVGFGTALNLALNNVFCANLANSTVILGAAHGSYGIGGILGPIVATALVSAGVLWSRFFLIMISVRIACFFFAGWSFWDYEQEGVSQFANSLQQLASRQAASEMGEPGKLDLLRKALRNKTTIVGALFIFAYQGAEVSESGWFISYLIDYRNGSPARVGYVTSGFWAGITVGRFTLTHLAHWVGEKRFVFAMGAGVIVFQIMSWQIPNVIGDAVAVAILGLLLGPVYPCAATVFTKLLPGNLQTMAIGFISGAGSSGGAVVPFLTGLVAQASGTWVLHPVCIGFYLIMLGSWTVLPKVGKRKV
ncbi:hypothetical protein LTR53_010431 [Teratosphaeriaceae sp. CCFEE 6253]|nr:hypothetical protein LTR53_010431 [Teratosphaeriaceae sp. CCFEE 6253]